MSAISPEGSPEPVRKPGARTPLQRLQYRLYSGGTAMNYFLRRRIRPAGIGVLMIIVVATGAAAGNPEPPVYQTFALAVALAVVGLLFLPFRRAKIEAVRDLPQHATAGQPLTYRERPGYDHGYYFVGTFIGEHLRFHAAALN